MKKHGVLAAFPRLAVALLAIPVACFGSPIGLSGWGSAGTSQTAVVGFGTGDDGRLFSAGTPPGFSGFTVQADDDEGRATSHPAATAFTNIVTVSVTDTITSGHAVSSASNSTMTSSQPVTTTSTSTQSTTVETPPAPAPVSAPLPTISTEGAAAAESTVPEPGTWLLLATGLIGLAGGKFARKRA